jgi:parvulin-like peptidyl-prolyl isomerase
MMKQTSILIRAVLVCGLILLCGCAGKGSRRFTEEEMAKMPLAQREGLPACSGGLVLAVNDDALTLDEIVVPAGKVLGPLAKDADIEEFERLARPQLEQFVQNKIADLLIYQQAKKSLPDNIDEAIEKAVQQEESRFLARFGGDYARAEKVLKEMGLDWQDFYEEQRKMIITQSFLSEQLNPDKSGAEPVTHRQLLELYDAVKEQLYATEGRIEFRLIDIRQGPEMQKEAKALAEQLVERARKGEDFGQLAKKFSQGHRASYGGLWSPVQPGSLAQPYDVLEKAAEELKAGQISEPIEADGHIFIMKLENKQERSFKPFEEVQHELERRLRLKQREKIFENLLAKYEQQADIGDVETFIELCLQEIYRRHNK